MRVKKSGHGDDRNEGVSGLANHMSQSHEAEHDFAEYQKKKTAAPRRTAVACTIRTAVGT